MDIRQYGAEVVTKAHRIGIPVVAGTDSDYAMVPIFTIGHEAINLITLGFSSMNAIRSITSTSAKLVRIGNHTGTLRPGLDADVVVLSENPLDVI